MRFGCTTRLYVVFLIAILTAATCRATAAPSTPIRVVPMVPTDVPTYAIAGRPLIVPLAPGADVEGGLHFAPDKPPVVAINGRVVEASTCRLLLPASALSTGGWEPEARAWTAAPMSVPDRKGRVSRPAIAHTDAGFWAVLTEAPADLERPVVSVNGRAAPIVWLDPPPPVTGAGRPVRPVAPASAWRDLGERLRPLSLDPEQRWRVRLLLDRVSSDELWADAPPGAFDDPMIETLAVREEECWRCAIEELRRVDPVLSSDLLHALTAVTLLPNGVLVPAWPLDNVGVRRLLRALLDPAETRSRKAEYARAWLAAAPDAVAWVIDDADPRGPTLGVAELSGRRANVGLLFSAVPAPVMRSIVAHESISARLPLPTSEEPLDLSKIEIRAENWTGRLSVLTSAAAIRPPGLLTGPFFRAATHASWLSGRAVPAAGALATSAMIQPGGAPGAWQVFIQAAAPPSDHTGADRVILWIGPFGDPGAVITIDRGEASTSARRGGTPEAIDVRFGSTDAGWTALVDIPDDAISERSILLIGMERTLGPQRASWPRAVLPEQVEPGRLAVDLSTWGSLSGD